MVNEIGFELGMNDGTVRDEAHGPFLVGEGERLDDLQLGGMKIIQKVDGFRFGTDSVLLADFAAPKKGERVVDLGTGTGVLCLLMAGHQAAAEFEAVEIQVDMADMARRSVEGNGLEGRIRVWEMDMRDADKVLGCGKFGLVVCNPPYSPEGTAIGSRGEGKRVARHEGEGGCRIGDVVRVAARLVKNGGRVAMVYPAGRMLQLMTEMKGVGLEPKRVRIVQDAAGKVPKVVLVDAVKGAGEMLHWMAPLILKDADGRWSEEWHRIYRT